MIDPPLANAVSDEVGVRTVPHPSVVQDAFRPVGVTVPGDRSNVNGAATGDHHPPLAAVFVPGLAGHAAEFEALAELWDRGPTLCVDLDDAGDVSITGQARHVGERIEAAGIERFVAVGHSFGGLVALDLAVSRPDVVAGVAILDSPVQVPAPLKVALRMFAALLRTPVGPALLRAFFNATFAEADEPEFRQAVLERLARVPHRAATRIVRETFSYSSAAAFEAIQVPAVYVKANIPTKLDRLPTTVHGAEIGGVGHWIHVHRPHDVSGELRQLVVGAIAHVPHPLTPTN